MADNSGITEIKGKTGISLKIALRYGPRAARKSFTKTIIKIFHIISFSKICCEIFIVHWYIHEWNRIKPIQRIRRA